jgi:DNA transformation protein and related proteins
MSASEEFVLYITDTLSPVGHVQVGRMFGGALLKIDGNQLGVIFGDVLYFKVINEDLQTKYKKAGSKQFTYTRKDKSKPVIIKNWWTAPADALDNEAKLVELAEEVMKQY